MGAQETTEPTEETRLKQAADNLALAFAEFIAASEAMRPAVEARGVGGYIVTDETYHALERLAYAPAWVIGVQLMNAWRDIKIIHAAYSIASVTGRDWREIEQRITEWFSWESIEIAPSTLLHTLDAELITSLYAGSRGFRFAFDLAEERRRMEDEEAEG